MGNSATSDVMGQGKLILEMTLGKEQKLNKVLYVLNINKNLVSGSLLDKHGFHMVFETDKALLTKAGMYAGKGHVWWAFQVNVMTVTPKVTNEKKFPSVYLFESSILWMVD